MGKPNAWIIWLNSKESRRTKIIFWGTIYKAGIIQKTENQASDKSEEKILCYMKQLIYRHENGMDYIYEIGKSTKGKDECTSLWDKIVQCLAERDRINSYMQRMKLIKDQQSEKLLGMILDLTDVIYYCLYFRKELDIQLLFQMKTAMFHQSMQN